MTINALLILTEIEKPGEVNYSRNKENAIKSKSIESVSKTSW